MSDYSLPLNAYLERIRYDGPLTPSIETLRHLHRAQISSIPFENLDIFLGRSIKLDPISLVTKLIDERRGGYCYELNGLFCLVLQHLNFTVTPLAARVLMDGTMTPRSHRLTLVEVEGERWLADVGFGGNSLIEPIPLELDREFPQYLDTFRLRADAKLGFVLQHKIVDQWRDLYAFTLEECYPIDYHVSNYYVSTSPDSHFTHHIICTIPTQDARIILYNSELKIRRPDQTTTTQLTNTDAYREALQHHFGIVLPPGARLQSPHSDFSMQL
jgi:N-hydroxyarylamine O-acetyltransferase